MIDFYARIRGLTTALSVKLAQVCASIIPGVKLGISSVSMNATGKVHSMPGCQGDRLNGNGMFPYVSTVSVSQHFVFCYNNENLLSSLGLFAHR